MSHLLGISFDSAASPAVTLRALSSHDATQQPAGWGFGWYPAGGLAASVIKDPVPTQDAAMTSLLHDWDRFRGTVFLCHLKGAEKGATFQDIHPFARSHGGRDFLLAHSGDLQPALARALDLGEPPPFEPIGHTDSERAFCWLMKRIRERGARSLAELGWPELRTLLRELDEIGTANLLISDGHDLVAYRDTDGFGAFHFVRRRPPHATTLYQNEALGVDLNHPLDLTRVMLLIASEPLGDPADWRELEPGHMLVARRGDLTWSSQPDEKKRRLPAGWVQSAPRDPTADALAVAVVPTARGLGLIRNVATSVDARMLGMALPEVTRVMTVVHETSYRYEKPIERSTHIFRLRPVHDQVQEILEYRLEVSPDGVSRHFEDVFGNHTARMKIDKAYEAMTIRATSRVRIPAASPLFAPFRRTAMPLVWMPWQRQMMLPYLLPPELPETQLSELTDFAMSFAERQDHDLFETLNDMNTTIHRDFAYVSGATTLATTPFDVYVNRRGVCQDFANLLICLARLLNIPARYRVGYIYTGGDYENKIQSEASHAWVEVYLPWVGWRGFDPTNGCLAGLDHIRVASGRNYRDATPTSGTIFVGGGGEKLSVSVRVELCDDLGDSGDPSWRRY
jgi:transglutaminase-like putative cysteine protease/predicted glutamine amidotransferase